jgi:uncharacterized protein (DUF779 family)
MENVARVIATAKALALIDQLQAEHGRIIFHQSGGCCDGSAPMCLAESDLLLGSADVKLGMVGDVPFYMTESQFEYWQNTQIILDAVPGAGGMFSLERPTGLRFLSCPRLFDDDEIQWLAAHPVEHVSG